MQVALFVFQLGRRRWEARQVSGVRGWGVMRAAEVRGGLGRNGQGRDDGLELVWRYRGDGYFLKFTWHPNRPSRALQGISARAMVPICVHRAPRTPPDSTPGHIRSRDDFLKQE